MKKQFRTNHFIFTLFIILFLIIINEIMMYANLETKITLNIDNEKLMTDNHLSYKSYDLEYDWDDKYTIINDLMVNANEYEVIIKTGYINQNSNILTLYYLIPNKYHDLMAYYLPLKDVDEITDSFYLDYNNANTSLFPNYFFSSPNYNIKSFDYLLKDKNEFFNYIELLGDEESIKEFENAVNDFNSSLMIVRETNNESVDNIVFLDFIVSNPLITLSICLYSFLLIFFSFYYQFNNKHEIAIYKVTGYLDFKICYIFMKKFILYTFMITSLILFLVNMLYVHSDGYIYEIYLDLVIKVLIMLFLILMIAMVVSFLTLKSFSIKNVNEHSIQKKFIYYGYCTVKLICLVFIATPLIENIVLFSSVVMKNLYIQQNYDTLASISYIASFKAFGTLEQQENIYDDLKMMYNNDEIACLYRMKIEDNEGIKIYMDTKTANYYGFTDIDKKEVSIVPIIPFYKFDYVTGILIVDDDRTDYSYACIEKHVGEIEGFISFFNQYPQHQDVMNISSFKSSIDSMYNYNHTLIVEYIYNLSILIILLILSCNCNFKIYYMVNEEELNTNYYIGKSTFDILFEFLWHQITIDLIVLFISLKSNKINILCFIVLLILVSVVEIIIAQINFKYYSKQNIIGE